MSVSCECCVMSGRDLCDELVPRPEESYRLWCVPNVCDHETSTKRGGPGPYRAVEPYKKNARKMYSIKTVKAQQAKATCHFKNTKQKSANIIWFNKICKTHQLTAKYIIIKVNGNNRQSLKATTKHRLNQELTPYVNRLL
jgi:hypothetical protein